MRHILLITALVFGFQLTAHAAQVKAVKGKKALVDLENDNFKKGDILKVENKTGKTVGLIKVTRVKGKLAEGLISGKAEKGFKLSLRPPKKGATKGTAKTARQSSAPSPSTRSKTVWGGMIGYSSASAEVRLQNAQTVELSGTGFSAKAFMDYPLFPWLTFRGLAGLEQFNIGGVNSAAGCPTGPECIAEISYLSADFWGKVHLGQGGIRPWIGAGLDIMFPLSKKSTALKESSISNTSVMSIGGGADWMTSDSSYFPIQIEYNIYPSNDQVKANALAVRIGFGKTF